MNMTLLLIVVAVGIIVLMCKDMIRSPAVLIRKLCLNGLLGLIILWLLNLAGSKIGLNIPLNLFTVFYAGALGVPGLAIMVVIEYVIIV